MGCRHKSQRYFDESSLTFGAKRNSSASNVAADFNRRKLSGSFGQGKSSARFRSPQAQIISFMKLS
jgi:hypothetical protein